MNSITHPSSCVAISYDAVRSAMNGLPFVMDCGRTDADSVQRAVNQGIDSCLEACFCPDRGDSFDWVGGKLCCFVSVESLPVLVRRLAEDFEDDNAASLADSILTVLGFNEYGQFVGRED
ncbi:MAG TPA: hypothetical protein VFG04_03810 [Planctomycetaceae bacterium]|jgi:hypothetical protein|nr:hypothetical protein [Planctomycetaceae bacterium]